MREVVVISGKGGTGKTSLTASFASIGGRDLVLADCDVDAANLHLLLHPENSKSEPFYSGHVAQINERDCTLCGACEEACHFDALKMDGVKARMVLDPLSCEGCGYCRRICTEKAISMKERLAGNWFASVSKTGAPMIHARLGIGAENSGKLVAKVKKEARLVSSDRDESLILVDGSPGIGCPVISSLTGASFVVLVTEPTISGFHDLKRVVKLLEPFKVKAGCIINKFDLNLRKSRQIQSWTKQQKLVLLGKIPYNPAFTRAMAEGKTMMEWNEPDLREIIENIWYKILNEI